tara:strand:+ start:258 stop:455 length:198 start_codon:yes stop_codon:yes gene_type:complete
MKQLPKYKWLAEKVTVDIYGRNPGLSDTPLTVMTREQAFKKRNIDNDDIHTLYQQYVSKVGYSEK